MKDRIKNYIDFTHEDYFLIEQAFESLTNDNNIAILTPFLNKMQKNLQDSFNDEVVPTDIVFTKDMFIVFGKLTNDFNKELINKIQTTLKGYLLSFPVEKNNSYNIALEMSFYDQGTYDFIKGIEETDYPILISKKSISSWLSGWNDAKNNG